MDSVGAEVGQKMRSAIKAKLLELNCYVDDELPDYIMVMVANRRTKSQMNEDLNLFLNTKTEPFVDWLHIVLKKLKEVTVTNPEVYKKVSKRKSSDQGDLKVKKEKKTKKPNEKIKRESDSSLTDDLPLTPQKLLENRKITLMDESGKEEKVSDDFDIPLLSDVNTSNEKDLQEIERKIRSVKSRLGIPENADLEEMRAKLEKEQLEQNNVNTSENITDEINIDEINIDEINIDETGEISFVIQEKRESPPEEISLTPERPRKHSPITFENKTPPKRPSILQRLGQRVHSRRDSQEKKSDYKKREQHFTRHSSRERHNDKNDTKDERRHRRDRHELRRSRERRIKIRRESSESPKHKSRSDNKNTSHMGVMSKIYVPEKQPEEPDHEDELKTREVRSMVQVKPRVLLAGTPQANKNLLLKAVAEANRSVSEAAANAKPRVSERLNGTVPLTRKLSHREKVKLRNIILEQFTRENSDSNDEAIEFEYVPKPLTKRSRLELPEYVPSSRESMEETPEPPKTPVKTRLSAKARLEGRKSPSPILFDKTITTVSIKADIPDKLPIIHPPISLKTKERCKYWPNCRQGDKCEFVHPFSSCEMFPNCQFGDKCLFIHPTCKFGTGCTKRDCNYSHSSVISKIPVTQPQTCKFFPKCTNNKCLFYHPKLCKFGKYCNISDCSFSHLSTVNKSSLTWRSKV